MSRHIYVTIEQMYYVIMAHSGADGCFVFIVHSRWMCVVGTKRYSVCLVFLNGADVCVNCYKVILCDSSGEYPKFGYTHVS